MANAAWALQSAIFAALINEDVLLALLGGPRVYDDVPARADFPYVTFGQSTERDWSTATETGTEHVVTLHIWSRKAGRKETEEVIEAVRSALHDRELTLSGHRLINFRHDFSDVRRDPDGETFHGVSRYRGVTEPL